MSRRGVPAHATLTRLSPSGAQHSASPALARGSRQELRAQTAGSAVTEHRGHYNMPLDFVKWPQCEPSKEAPVLSGADASCGETRLPSRLPAAPMASGRDSQGRCRKGRVPGRRQ